MNVFETASRIKQSVSLNIIHPAIKGISEYINTLYYTNQLVAYALCIITLATKETVQPLIIAISVPTLAALLFTFFIYTKKYPPKKGTCMYSIQRGLFRLTLSIYSNVFSICMVSILSSICLVLSFEALLHYYTSIMSKTIAIDIAYTLATIAVIAALKLCELIANLPIIKQIIHELNESDTANDSTDPKKIINKNQEHYKILLHCFNYFIGFVTNSLTVILALASAATTAVSFTGAVSILASVAALSIVTCLLIYQKHQNKIQNIYQVTPPEQSPTTVPSIELLQGMGTMVADDRAKIDNIFALMQMSGIQLTF